MDPEDLARKAMLTGETLLPPPPAPVVPLPEVSVPTPAARVAAPQPGITAKLSKWCNASNMKSVMNNPLARYVLVFVVTSILLVVIAPPFVQIRRKNQLEKAPTSYKRVIIVATITTAMVALLPLCLANKSKFMFLTDKVKKWF